MYLKSLKVSDFAGLGTAEVADLSHGLNVVVGNNEAGKSTLLKALRAAFFQKHRGRGEAVEAFLPYKGDGRPQVSVDFLLGDVEYNLSKAFIQRASAELRWPTGSLSSDAVEEKLAELLGFNHPGRGDPKLAEHQGAFGLLWVEQGRSNGGLDLGAGKSALTASLEREVGQMLGGERGRTLIQAAKTLQDRFFTGTGRTASHSPIKQIDDDVQRLRLQLTEKQEAWRDLEEKLARLDDRRRRLKDYDDAQTLAKAEEALRQAEEAERRAAERDGEWHAAQAALKHAETLRAGAAERLGRRDRLRADVDAATAGVEAHRLAFAEASSASQAASQRLTDKDGARRAAREAERAIEEAHERLRQRDELARERQALAALAEAIQAVVAIDAERVAKRKDLEAIRVDDRALAAIEKAERHRRDCEIGLSVASPFIVFEPDGESRAHVAGSTEALGERFQVSAATRFALEGFGYVTVEPGGNAGKLAEEDEAARTALANLLRRAGVDTLDSARRAASAASAFHAELQSLAARRDALLPKGLDEARIREEALKAAVARLGAAVGVEAPDSDMPSAEILRERMKEAQRSRQAAEAEMDRAREDANLAAMGRATAESDLSHRQGEATRLSSELAEAEASVPRVALIRALGEAEAEREAKAALLALRQSERDAANPAGAAAERASRREALERISRTVAQLRDETLSLEGEIRGKEGSGLGEAISELEGEIAVLESRSRRLSLEAEASRLLHATLVEAQREAREMWLGPIKSRVAPYLRLIHPDSEIELDEETLDIRGLSRGGVEEKFERLSAGAREQVAVVTRLALAHVLKQGGHPATVILDDALVNTDEDRLDRMHHVLREAARELQIIVLTCRERDFRDLGAPIFRL